MKKQDKSFIRVLLLHLNSNLFQRKINKFVDKLEDFFVKSNRNSFTNSKKLTKTMKSYINQEVVGNSTIKDTTNKYSNGRRLSQESANKTNYDMNIYFKLNLMRDMQNDKCKSK